MSLELSDLFSRADDILKPHFKRIDYLDILIPFVLIRRMDFLAGATGLFDSSLTAVQIEERLDNYSVLLSPQVLDVLAHFDFDATLARLKNYQILIPIIIVMQHLDVNPDRVTNTQMGDWFEEMMRKCIDLNDSFAEYYTPKEVSTLLTMLLFTDDKTDLSLYDPCCGTGGLLTVAIDYLREHHPDVNLNIYGQEINNKTIAIAKADLYLREPTGTWASQIGFGSTLSANAHAQTKFDRITANPPYGFKWLDDKDAVEKEYAQGLAGFHSRFKAGLPRIGDGQFLFFMHIVDQMKSLWDGGSRAAIVSSGSPLFTGDATQGETQIRRYLFENDLIETIIALPEDLFYNTDIATYIWVLSTDKAPERKGKTLLIDARTFFKPMTKTEGNKRRYMADEHLKDIMHLWETLDETSPYVKLYPNEFFGYRRITIDRPVRRTLKVTSAGLEAIKEHKAFKALATSKKTDSIQKAIEEAQGQIQQNKIIQALQPYADQYYVNLAPYVMPVLDGLKLNTAVRSAILQILSVKDQFAPAVLDAKGRPEADSDLRDHEYVPLGEDVNAYFEREVQPFWPDAWISTKDVDLTDKQVGIVGYEINFSRYFYEPKPQTPLAEIRGTIDTAHVSFNELLARLTNTAHLPTQADTAAE